MGFQSFALHQTFLCNMRILGKALEDPAMMTKINLRHHRRQASGAGTVVVPLKEERMRFKPAVYSSSWTNQEDNSCFIAKRPMYSMRRLLLWRPLLAGLEAECAA